MRDRSVHFSVDDTIWLFSDWNSGRYSSVFEQPTLAFFRDLHQKYGIVVSFYCFGEQDWMRLEDVTDRYREELEENSGWLRFGFHAKHENMRYAEAEAQRAAGDYAEVTAQLRRIAGAVLDGRPRLHCYSANRFALEAMKSEGLRGVLCSESEEMVSYDLKEAEAQQVRTAGVFSRKLSGLTYLATDIRIETEKCILESLLVRKERPHIEIFTHEWALNQGNTREKILICCSMMKKMGYQGGFWEGE